MCRLITDTGIELLENEVAIAPCGVACQIQTKRLCVTISCFAGESVHGTVGQFSAGVCAHTSAGSSSSELQAAHSQVTR